MLSGINFFGRYGRVASKNYIFMYIFTIMYKIIQCMFLWYEFVDVECGSSDCSMFVYASVFYANNTRASQHIISAYASLLNN